MQAENKKSNIKTLSFGCRLNALESEKIRNILESEHFLFLVFWSADNVTYCLANPTGKPYQDQSIGHIK